MPPTSGIYDLHRRHVEPDIWAIFMKYRRVFWGILVLIFVFTGIVAAAPTKPVIKADKTYYDINTGLYVLRGNVYIQVRDRIITAEQAKVSLSSLEVWGMGGITLTQGDIYLEADSVHVFGSQNKAVIEGDLTFRRTGLTVIADRVEFDWKTKLCVFNGNVTVTQNESTWQAISVTYNVATGEFISTF